MNVLALAQGGDEVAFGQLIDPHRPGLFAHCYRMLGSPHDAEDALQDSLLRAWRGLPRFEGRSSLKSWLYTIATNASLRALERRPSRLHPIDHGPASEHNELGAPLVESVFIEPAPDSAVAYEDRESLELAFIAALQVLPARQRAVLVLRDVLSFSAGEVAEMLETTDAAVHSALQRAHATIDSRLPERSQQQTLRGLDDAELRTIVDGYMDAWERSDVDALAALLTDDAVLSMPPFAEWFRGRDQVLAFLAERPLDGKIRWPSVATSANGQLAFGHYRDDGDGQAPSAHSITLLEVEGGRISAMTAFLDDGLFALFGLPDRL